MGITPMMSNTSFDNAEPNNLPNPDPTAQKMIDPHFSNNKNYCSPIARFNQQIRVGS